MAKIINAKNNKPAKAMYEAVTGEELDEHFGPAMVEFELTVPIDYNHDTQIDTSAKKAKKEKITYYYNDDLTSKNFANATNKLVPGKTYKVKIFPILQTVTSKDCMALLRKSKAILVGGQGTTLVYDLAKDKLPKGKYTISFDEKKRCGKTLRGIVGCLACSRTGAVTSGSTLVASGMTGIQTTVFFASAT